MRHTTPSGQLSRRHLLGLFAAAPLLAGCTDSSGRPVPAFDGEAPRGVLGANVNEKPEGVTFAMLDGAKAGWLRGFVLMSEVHDAASMATRPTTKLLMRAHERGYGTVLSLKFQNSKRSLPEPGSDAMRADLARVDAALDVALGKVAVLTIGNEPFLETREDQRGDRLNEYYEEIVRHVVEQRSRRFPDGCRTRLYLGALNRISLPDGQTPATARWLEFARSTPELEGVDIHPHVESPDEVQVYLDYVLPRLRPEQTFLATEFSLVHLWKKHLTDRVPSAWAERYGKRAETAMWQAIRSATRSPLPADEWDDLLALSPWYDGNKTFVQDQVQRFRQTGRLAVATYGFAQDAAMARGFGPKKMPWILNSVYANRTVRSAGAEVPASNYGAYDAFRAVQRSEDLERPVRTGRATG